MTSHLFSMIHMPQITRKKYLICYVNSYSNRTSQYFKIVSTSLLEMHIRGHPSQKAWTENKNYENSI